jgi:hypothetical protein
VFAAFDQAVGEAARRMARSWVEVGNGRWQRRVRAALAALLQFMDEQPDTARLLIVESLAAGERTLARRQEVNERLVVVVDGVRAEGATAEHAPHLAAEGAVGAVLSVLHSRLLERRSDSFVGLLNPLMSMLVAPFLGAAAARRELEHPAPAVPVAHPQPGPAALGKLEMRVTYRTMRALAAVAASPGASNRSIGASAGITDQGQASKLLRRLQRLGLVENIPKEPHRGEPNSWTLTKKGWQIHAAIKTENGSS